MEPTVRQLLRKHTAILEKAGMDTPRLDAEVLLAHVLEWTRERLYINLNEVPSEDHQICYANLINRRVNGEPVAYITGTREFMSLDFEVNPHVLIPRPETEIMVERIIQFGKTVAYPGLLIDVGTGSGAIGISVAKYLESFRVIALDISSQALAVASRNAAKQGVASRISYVESDLLGNCPSDNQGSVDYIAANLPYISSGDMLGLPKDVRDYEPELALVGGIDGLDLYRRLIPQAIAYLKPSGYLAMEIGPGQGQPLMNVLADEDWADQEIFKDYAGLERFVIARKRN